MELWLRHYKAKNFEWDERIIVTSGKQWREAIDNPRLISSILWPCESRFPIAIEHKARHHPHEQNYTNDSERNQSYLNACRRIAGKLDIELAGASCLVYAPLRGALPIWRAIRQFLKAVKTRAYFPVTSSFVSFPKKFGILDKRGKIASGRYNNVFELQRLMPFYETFDILIYVDEIVSGSMMRAHLMEMFRLKINERIPVVAVGLADAFGKKSESKRRVFDEYIRLGQLKKFIWEGCQSLITQDQKFLLGAHYADYESGPRVVPLLENNLRFYKEKKELDKEVYFRKDIAFDRFCAAAR